MTVKLLFVDCFRSTRLTYFLQERYTRGVKATMSLVFFASNLSDFHLILPVENRADYSYHDLKRKAGLGYSGYRVVKI